MEYFLETSGTIEDGKGFSTFGTVHLIWLAITVATVLFGCIFWRKLQGKALQRWKITMAVLIVANDLFKTVCLLIGGNYTVGYLPLHLCSINIFVIAVHAFRPGKTLDNFLYTICIPGAIAALLFPSWTKLPVLNFMHLHSFTFHILLILCPAVLTACGAIRPNIRNIPGSLLLLVAFAAVFVSSMQIWERILCSWQRGLPVHPWRGFRKTGGAICMVFL